MSEAIVGLLFVAFSSLLAVRLGVFPLRWLGLL